MSGVFEVTYRQPPLCSHGSLHTSLNKIWPLVQKVTLNHKASGSSLYGFANTMVSSLCLAESTSAPLQNKPIVQSRNEIVIQINQGPIFQLRVLRLWTSSWEVLLCPIAKGTCSPQRTDSGCRGTQGLILQVPVHSRYSLSCSASPQDRIHIEKIRLETMLLNLNSQGVQMETGPGST